MSTDTFTIVWREIDLEARFGGLEELARTTEEYFLQRVSELQEQISKEQSSKEGEPSEAQIELYYSEKELPILLRQSIFVTFHSSFETHLRQLQKEHSRKISSKLKLIDLQGSEIEQIRTYFKKVAEIDFPDSTKTWSNLTKYKDIRDVLVHHRGILADDVNESRRERVRLFIEKN